MTPSPAMALAPTRRPFGSAVPVDGVGESGSITVGTGVFQPEYHAGHTLSNP